MERRHKRGHKAQASIEFLAAFSIVLLLFIAFSFVLYQKFVQSTEIQRDMAGRRISNSLAGAINSILLAGPGTSVCTTLPGMVSLDEYSVKFYREEPTVFVCTDKQTWASPVMTPRLNCTLEICSFSENATTMRINETIDIEVSYESGTLYLKECK